MAEYVDCEASVERCDREENEPAGPSRPRQRRQHRPRASADSAPESSSGPPSNQFWCFTLNNPSADELVKLRAYAASDRVRYAIWQSEVGENGTSHLQGYLELRRRTSRGTLHRMFRRIHFEARRGTREEARNYCTKVDTAVPGTLEEYGKWDAGGQGARTDLSEVTQALQAGQSVCEVILAHPAVFARHPRFIPGFKSALCSSVKRAWLTKVFVFIGGTGTGKTRLAHRLWPDLYVKVVASDRSLWLDGYEGHRHVLIDDFHGPEIPLPTLLRLCDRHPCEAPIKGGHVNFSPFTICITSNVELEHWYPTANLDHVAALRRRVFKLLRFPLSPDQLTELEAESQYGTTGGVPLERNV